MIIKSKAIPAKYCKGISNSEYKEVLFLTKNKPTTAVDENSCTYFPHIVCLSTFITKV